LAYDWRKLEATLGKARAAGGAGEGESVRRSLGLRGVFYALMFTQRLMGREKGNLKVCFTLDEAERGTEVEIAYALFANMKRCAEMKLDMAKEVPGYDRVTRLWEASSKYVGGAACKMNMSYFLEVDLGPPAYDKMHDDVAADGPRVDVSVRADNMSIVGKLAMCAACRSVEGMPSLYMKCARCRREHYCSSACQKSRWKKH
jgi:hypothetical protein